MTKYTLYIGLNDKDTKRQEIETVEAYKLVQRELVKKVGGGTIYSATGIYTHDDGSIVIEPTLRVEIFHDSKKDIKDLADDYKKILNQESIIIQTENVSSEIA